MSRSDKASLREITHTIYPWLSLATSLLPLWADEAEVGSRLQPQDLQPPQKNADTSPVIVAGRDGASFAGLLVDWFRDYSASEVEVEVCRD